MAGRARALRRGAVAVLAWRLARRGGAPPRAALAAGWRPRWRWRIPPGRTRSRSRSRCAWRRCCCSSGGRCSRASLAGVAAFWRLEFAAYLALGALLAYAVRDGWARAAPRYAGVAGARRARGAVRAVRRARRARADAFELLIRYPLLDFGDYQSLPFPLDYDGPLNTGSVGGFLSDSAESLLLFYLPLVLVLGLAGALAAGALRFRRDGVVAASRSPSSRSGWLHYLLARAGRVPHGAAGGDRRGARGLGGAGAAPRRADRRIVAAALARRLGFAIVEGADRGGS